MKSNAMKKLSCILLSVCIVLLSLPSEAFMMKAKAEDYKATTYVASIEDFKKLANICRFDNKSQDMLVVLTADIDFTGRDMLYLPTFAGTFDGGGHTISGVGFSGSESPIGLFMTLQETGTIRNLNVNGRIAPTDTTDAVGGIVGINEGTIENCTFSGSISGRESVGGIAGINEITGTISTCSFSGVVFGKSMTGGIAGQNEGAIRAGKNYGVINNVSVDPTLSLDDFEFDFESAMQALTSLDTYNVAIDSGGIAGYSSGMILSCYNYADIGYQHIGYNVGGIAGRSSGFVNNCANYGQIFGRKNIAGIVGIAEPYTILNTSPDNLTDLREQINILSDMVNSAINDAEGSSATISNRLKSLSASIDSSADRGEELSSKLKDYWNANVSEVNRTSLIVDDAIEQIDVITDGLPAVSDKITTGMKQVEDVISFAESASGHAGNAMDRFAEAAEQAADAVGNMQDGCNRISLGVDKLDEAFEIKSSEQFEQGLKFILDGMSALSSAVNSLSSALDVLAKAIADDKWVDDFNKELDDMSALMTEMSEYLDKISDDLQIINDNLDIHYDSDSNTIVGAIDLEIGDADALEAAFEDMADVAADAMDTASQMNDVFTRMNATLQDAGVWLDKVQAASVKVTSSFSRLTDSISLIDVGVQMIRDTSELSSSSAKDGKTLIKEGFDSFTLAMAQLEAALRTLEEGINELGLASDDTEMALKSLNEARGTFTEASDMMTEVFQNVDGLADYLNGVDPVQFKEIDPEIEASADSLYSSISEISRQTDRLNQDAKNASDRILEDVRKINDQVSLIANLMIDMIFDVTEASYDDKFSDTSEEDVNSVTNGRIFKCENNGDVYGDVAVGGIAGSMANYDVADPEGDTDLTINSVFKKKYELKAVIQRSVNRAKVVAKRNNAAGICGDFELGMIVYSSNFGRVESESGANVGGIAGGSNSTIRNCYSKCSLSASQNVGGIIGAAKEDSLGRSNSSVEGCLAMVEISGAELFYGAIAGEYVGEFEENYYVSDDLAGINRISYDGKAESLTYDALMKIDGIPSEFRSFEIRFIADEEVVQTISFNYGDTVDSAEAPSVPRVEGCFGVWDNLDFENLHFDKTVTAEYASYVTALESEQKRENGLAVIFVQGLFDDKAKVSVSDSSLGNFDGKEPTEMLHLEFDADGQSEHTIRYLPEENRFSGMKTLTLYVYSDGEWCETEYSMFGSYMQFEASGTSVDFCIACATSKKVIILAAVIAVVLISIVIIIIALRKRKKVRMRND